ncbi:MipA/OmpV family protein [Vibrio sp. PP-XX7]
MDYYYGVEANEVRIDRAAYAGQSTVNLSAGFRTDYHITNNQTVMMDISPTKFGSGITDSSLVDTSTVPEALVGYMYRF